MNLMRNKVGIYFGVLLSLVLVIPTIVQSEYESDDYYLNEALILPFGGTSQSAEYSAAFDGGFGLKPGESTENFLGAGSREQSVLPTPPAPDLSVANAENALLLKLTLGSNDPAVLAQVAITDNLGVLKYYNPAGQAVSESNTWHPYKNWGGSAGAQIGGLNENKSYSAQTRYKYDDHSVSAWSNSSAQVSPVTVVPLTASEKDGLIGVINSVGQAIKDVASGSTVQSVAKDLAIALVPLTAIAVAAQLASVSAIAFQFIAEIISRLVSSMLSGLQFFAFYKKRKVFGRVIDGKTREPIAGVNVFLIKPDTKRVLDTQQTDKDGRYYFLFDDRTSYLVKAEISHYDPYEKTVRGNVNHLIRMGVKLEYDIEELNKRRKIIMLVDRINYFRTALLFFGVLAWALIFTFQDKTLMVFLLGSYYVLALIFELYVRRQPRPYGLVEDVDTRVPLSMVVIRIKDALGAIVETLVCDEKGRFRTLLRPGKYTFTFNKQGYLPNALNDVHISQSIHSLAVTAKLRRETA